MCAVSVILDYGSKIERTSWTKDSFNGYKDLLERAKEWDEKTNQPDCPHPEKEKWMDLVENMLMKRGKMEGSLVKDEDLPQWIKDMRNEARL